MAITYLSTAVASVVFNGLTLDKVVLNGTAIFEKVTTPVREPASGEYYDDTHRIHSSPNGGSDIITWDGVGFGAPARMTSYSYNGYTYYKGTCRLQSSYLEIYAVYRIKN